MSIKNKKEPGNKDLLNIAINKFNNEIDEKSPSNKARWKDLEKKFIEEGIWQKSILSRIFYWPSDALDRLIAIIKTFVLLMLGVGIATIQTNLLITRSGDEPTLNEKSISSESSYSSEIILHDLNPINLSQQIIISSLKEGLISEIYQSDNQQIFIILKNLKKNKHIGLKAILEIPPQFHGNIKVIIKNEE